VTQELVTPVRAVPPVDAPAGLRGRRFPNIAQYAGFIPALILYGVFFVVPL
jgi:hypothetical protein